MTVSEVIDWYQKHIEELEEERVECETLNDMQSVHFHDGAIFGLKLAIIILKGHEREGLKGMEEKV